MKKLLTNVSLKFGAIYGGIDLLTIVVRSITFNPDSLSKFVVVLPGILSSVSIISLIACITMAHYEFNNKNANFISFQNAIMIGLIIIGISITISTVYSSISYNLLYLNPSGTKIDETNFSKFIFYSLLAGILSGTVLLFLIITAESLWKIYKKAGKNGWASIVPIYNIIVLLEIVNKPTWWSILLLIPFVNIIFAIWLTNLLSKRFNKDESFTIGLIILPFIFYPLLGMGKAVYTYE